MIKSGEKHTVLQWPPIRALRITGASGGGGAGVIFYKEAVSSQG